uniref:Retrotransposon gag domain-containing protein n=1 Tax=Arundo donax TaxID=35708 RepID=A0A0A8XT76_ARUDO
MFHEHGSKAIGSPHFSSLPRMDFSSFDGAGPKAWRSRCESYFHIFNIQPELWVSIASLHLSGSAALWWQANNSASVFVSWEEFMGKIGEKFGRMEFQVVLHQFANLKQTGSVLDYTEKFNDLMDTLVAHHQSWEPMYFVTQFLDGLRDEIRIAVVLHRPKDLDTAVSLACMQEELLELSRRCDPRRHDQSTGPRAQARSALPSPSVPGKGWLILGGQNQPEDRRGMEGARAGGGVPDHRMAAWRSYCRANGLCYRCKEKWSHDHICTAQVEINEVELLDYFCNQVEGQTDPNQEEETESLELMAISKEAVVGTEAARTIRFISKIQGKDALTLLDSGSFNCFISEVLAQQLSGEIVPVKPMRVRVAGGGIMYCCAELRNCTWEVQGHKFISNFRILPLGCYDVIIGMDWLELYSPMNTHWAHKRFSFQYQGNWITIQGIRPGEMDDTLVSSEELKSMCYRGEVQALIQLCVTEVHHDISDLPVQVIALIQEFENLFAEPKELPPQRDQDHPILWFQVLSQ